MDYAAEEHILEAGRKKGEGTIEGSLKVVAWQPADRRWTVNRKPEFVQQW